MTDEWSQYEVKTPDATTQDEWSQYEVSEGSEGYESGVGGGKVPMTNLEESGKRMGLVSSEAVNQPENALPPDASWIRKSYEYLGKPLLETGALTVGGLVGVAAGGPVGALAGAGLAYSGAKEIEKIGEEYAGIRQPVPLGQGFIKAGENVLVGVTSEAIGQSAGTLIAGKVARNKMDIAERQVAEGLAKDYPKPNTPLAGKTAKNIQEAERLEENIPGLEFNLAQKTDLPGIIAGQKALKTRSAEAIVKERDMHISNMQAISKKIDGIDTQGKSIYDALEALKQKQGALTQGEQVAKDALEARYEALTKERQDIIDKFREQADDLAQRLMENPGKAKTGEAIRTRVEAKENALIEKSSELYTQVPIKINVTQDIAPLQTAIEQVKAEHPAGISALYDKADAASTQMLNKWFKPQEEMPSIILGPSGRPMTKTTTPMPQVFSGELRELEKYLTKTMIPLRTSNVPGDRDLARRLLDIKQSINAVYEANATRTGNEGLIQSLGRAKAFTINEVVPLFRAESAPSRQILEKDVSGSLKLSDALVGKKYLPTGDEGYAAGQNYKAIFGDDNTILNNYAASDLIDKAYDTNKEWSLSTAKSWLNSHAPILKETGLFNKFVDDIRIIETASKIEKKLPQINMKKLSEYQAYLDAQSKLTEFNKGAAGKMLGGDVKSAIANALAGNGGNVGAAIQQLKKQVGLNPEALQGLRQEFKEVLFSTWQETAKKAKEGQALNTLEKMFDKVEPGLRELFSSEELQVMTEAQRALRIMMRQDKNVMKASETALFLNRQIDKFRIAVKASTLLLGHGPGFTIGTDYFAKQRSLKYDDVLSRVYFDPQYAQSIMSAWKGAGTNISVNELTLNLYKQLYAIGGLPIAQYAVGEAESIVPMSRTNMGAQITQ